MTLPKKLVIKEEFHPWHVIVLCLITAALAELALSNFVPEIKSVRAGGRIAIVFLSLYTIHRFALAGFHYYSPKLKDLICLHLITIGSIVIVAIGRVLSLALSDYINLLDIVSPIDHSTLHFAIPFAAGGMLIQAVLGLHVGLVFALGLSIIIGVYTANDNLPVFVAYIFITNLIACLSMSRFRTRSAYIKAGFNVAVISIPFALAAFITDNDISAIDLLVSIVSCAGGGALCWFIAAGVTPAIEYLGGYVTDMRLIEISTLDHPLLKELSLQAPGTWNHSMVIGMMVEAAADEIGANPVLARVGAYFHDVGKLKKPAYFIENQAGENRHNKLSTSMSVLIIRTHVKDGIELARKHKIPEAVVDMVPQHHGTSLIEYFYNKALKDAEDADEPVEVDKNLYTYPGPKPQTREAGLLMLADKIESSARTLSEPSLDRIQGLVQKMINKVFASGELNECELTLRDLHTIAACYTRVLNSIYHQRIAYSEPAEKTSTPADQDKGGISQKGDQKGKKTEGKKKHDAASGNRNSNSAKQPKESETREMEDDSSEDLKRLGMGENS